ncbi:hypothetical protein [Saccharopolyspora cebuensis]|uniref:Abi-like protein n=1 Tax=Saccharopolyspora cebuensis TaxID=418759 RepID=A0ABV4CLG2_9PSEU
MIDDPDEQSTAWVQRALSPARLAPYLAAAGGGTAAALELYRWNLDLCAAFYPPLHWCEIALRNAMHSQLRSYFGAHHWWDVAPLNENGRSMIGKARDDLAKRGRRETHTPDDIVAAVPLGFWVSLTSRGDRYDQTFWKHSLYFAFPHLTATRRVLHRDLNGIREFRNRIMHHEPIFNRNLPNQRDRVHRVIGYLSTPLYDETIRVDRIQTVLAAKPGHAPL